MQLERPEAVASQVRKLVDSGEDPWQVAMLFQGRENETPPELLELLLDATKGLLARELDEPSPADKKPLYRPLSYLSKISRPDLLEQLWRRRTGPLETRLTQWLVREGPNDSGWAELSTQAGRDVLTRIAGHGLGEVAATYLETAQTYLGREPAFGLALRHADERCLDLLRETADRQEKDEIGGEKKFPLSQRNALVTLAALVEAGPVVRGVVRWGLELPKDFQEYLEGQELSVEALRPALEAIEEGADAPLGAALALGLSGRPEMAEKIHQVLAAAEEDSPLALGCLLGLEALGDQCPATEEALIRALRVPDHQYVAGRAIVTRVATPRCLEALLQLIAEPERCRNFGLIAANLLIIEETRRRAAQLLWDRLDRHRLHTDIGPYLHHLAVLDDPRVREFLYDEAFHTDVHRMNWSPPIQWSAIRGLKELEPSLAFEAARTQLLDGPAQQRSRYPQVLLEIDQEKALGVLVDRVAQSADRVLLHAIGKALDATGQEASVREWLVADNTELRLGACRVAAAMAWSEALDSVLLSACRDRDWDVRDAAWPALEAVRRERDVCQLTEMLREESDLARRWSIVDAALQLGDPGVVPGGAGSWVAELCRGLPYAMRKHVGDGLKKKREELVKKLEKEGR